MSGDDDFEPRLGRIRALGGGRGKTYLERVLRAAANAGSAKNPGKADFRGNRIGRGAGAGRVLGARDRYAAFRARRVLVKSRIVRIGARGLKGAALHLRYIQRDGVTREGAPGTLYDRYGEGVDDKAFLERAEGDRHQFRFIVSPEDGTDYDDLKPFVRFRAATAAQDTSRIFPCWLTSARHRSGTDVPRPERQACSMRGRRVLHVFKHFRPEFTGEGIFLERLAPVFRSLRPDIIHEVVVTETPRPARFAPPPGIEAVHFLDEMGIAAQSTLVRWLARNGGNFATVHYHTHVDRSFVASMFLRLRACRLILSATLDDSLPGLLRTYRPLYQPLVRLLSRVISNFVAISPRLFEENNRLLPAAKSAFIPMGITIPPSRSEETRAVARRKLDIAKDSFVFVCVGGLCARKDQLFLVEQMAGLVRRRPNIVLLLVGPVVEPAYCAALEAAVSRAGLAQHVQFKGYREPWDFYDAADVMAFASREEGFGTVVIEAMARGLPVLVRRLPGVNDAFVESGVSGFFFDDAADFQGAAMALIEDDLLRNRMGERGRALVAARYDISGVAARYLDLYGFPVEAAAA